MDSWICQISTASPAEPGVSLCTKYEDGTRQPGPVEAPLVTYRRLPSRFFSQLLAIFAPARVL
jgi:hypothetical protein